MRFVQLRAFHFVALELSFSAAGARLHLTQPAISDQISRLESAYDMRLFNRDKRSVSLTAKGEALLAITRRFFDAHDAALQFLQGSRILNQQHLTIMVDSVQHILPVIEAYREVFPKVQLNIATSNSSQILQALRDYQADIGVVGANIGKEFAAVSLGASPLTAFCANSSPWAALQNVTLRDLAELPLVLREPGSRTRQLLEELLAHEKLVMHTVIEAQGRETVREFVAHGVGVGVVSQAEFGFDPRLCAIRIADHVVSMEERAICLAERRDSPSI
ncbi:MAG: LysR substrate-binding domain-containing protein, partial [Pseudomonadota bacterium]